MNFSQESSPFLFLLSVAALLILLPTVSTAYPTPPDTYATDFIRRSCNVTLYPDICYTSLSRYASVVQNNPAKLARIALSVSLSKAQHMIRYVTTLSRQTSSAEPGAAAALQDCYSTFDDAVDQMQNSIKEMSWLKTGREELRFQMSNVQTWMSAALTNEETCTDGFEDVMDGPIKTSVCSRALTVKKFTSNGLALVNSFVQQQLGV